MRLEHLLSGATPTKNQERFVLLYTLFYDSIGKAGRRQITVQLRISHSSQAIEKTIFDILENKKRKQNLSKEKQLKVYINVRGHVKVIKYER